MSAPGTGRCRTAISCRSRPADQECPFAGQRHRGMGRLMDGVRESARGGVSRAVRRLSSGSRAEADDGPPFLLVTVFLVGIYGAAHLRRRPRLCRRGDRSGRVTEPARGRRERLHHRPGRLSVARRLGDPAAAAGPTTAVRTAARSTSPTARSPAAADEPADPPAGRHRPAGRGQQAPRGRPAPEGQPAPEGPRPAGRRPAVRSWFPSSRRRSLEPPVVEHADRGGADRRRAAAGRDDRRSSRSRPSRCSPGRGTGDRGPARRGGPRRLDDGARGDRRPRRGAAVAPEPELTACAVAPSGVHRDARAVGGPPGRTGGHEPGADDRGRRALVVRPRADAAQLPAAGRSDRPARRPVGARPRRQHGLRRPRPCPARAPAPATGTTPWPPPSPRAFRPRWPRRGRRPAAPPPATSRTASTDSGRIGPTDSGSAVVGRPEAPASPVAALAAESPQLCDPPSSRPSGRSPSCMPRTSR